MVYKSKKYVVGKDVDLDKEIIRDKSGKRITNKRAKTIIDEVLAQSVGRPSLSSPTITSPEVKARVPKRLKIALEREAKRRGETPSALIRAALEEFLKSA